MSFANGHGDPLREALQLELVLKRFKQKKPKGQDTRLPMTPLVLLRIKQTLMQDPHEYMEMRFVQLQLF